MNYSKSTEILSSDSQAYKRLLKSGALGTIVKNNAVRILDAENLKTGKFVRCEVGSVNPTGWGREIQWVDIPEINLQKAIKHGSSGTRTRAIVGNGAWIGDAHTVRIESYDSETHELHVIGQNSGRFTLKIPVTYSSFENTDNYHHDTDSLRKNPTEPPQDDVLSQMRNFIGK